MAYLGPRPILPGQNTGEWAHDETGEVGEYSNYSLQSSTHLLEDMPINDHVPGTGYHPHDVFLTQVARGVFRYAPMELKKFSHGGQSAPYLRHSDWEYHGLDGAKVFRGNWGHDGTRVLSTSRHSNLFYYGVPSGDATLDGHPIRYYGDAGVPSGFGRTQPYVNQGVTDEALENPGVTLANKPVGPEYGFQDVNEWHGVPSAKAL